jgi:mono/diheme cytochrome c family protein
MLGTLIFIAGSLAPAQEGSSPESLEADAQEIFEEYCTLCHDSTDDLNLEEARGRDMVGRLSSTGRPLLEAGNPDGSYLYAKLMGHEGIEGDPMPLDEEPLPAEQLESIAAWIRSIPAPEETSGPAPAAPAPADTPPGDSPAKAPSEDPEPVPEVRVVAQTPERRPARGRQPFHGTHQINLQTTTTLGKKVIAYRIHHRFGRVGGVGDRSYLGLANGVVMSMGLEYGIIDGLDVLARWTNSHLDWEIGAKYVPLRQEAGKPLSLGAFASFEGITDFPENAENRATGNFQVMVSRLWLERWSTQLTLGYSMFTNHDPHVVAELEGKGPTLVRDRRGTLNLALASTVWFGKKKKHGLDMEYILPIPDGGSPNLFYYHGGDADPGGANIGSWALGWSARTGLHLFQVFVTNTRNIHTNLIAPGGDTKNPFKPFGDFFFGFNISRKWKL